MTEGFDISLVRWGRDVRLVLSGDLDLAAVSEFKAALARAAREAHSRVVLDLSATTSVDATLMGALEAGRRAAAARGVTFILVNVRSPVRQALAEGLTATRG
jgi:anti-anti-sigma factor